MELSDSSITEVSEVACEYEDIDIDGTMEPSEFPVLKYLRLLAKMNISILMLQCWNLCMKIRFVGLTVQS